jgi:hypothetical protein
LFQVLEAIAHPYSGEFVQLFLPMVENEEITGTMRGDGDNDLVSEFISKYLNIPVASIFEFTYYFYIVNILLLQYTAKLKAQV